MAVNPNEDTEFNDALRKHGILPPREPPPRTPSPSLSLTLDEMIDELSTSELNDLNEDTEDDVAQRIIEQHKRRREIEERTLLKKARFGLVYPIGRDDYTREVTEASKESEEGTGVVCFLYKDGIPRSDRAFQHVKILAERHPRTKFVSIVGDKKGDIRNQIIAWGSERERRIEELEAILIVAGVIELGGELLRDKKNSDDGEEDRSSSRNVRKKDDSDSDFEFDL